MKINMKTYKKTLETDGKSWEDDGKWMEIAAARPPGRRPGGRRGRRQLRQAPQSTAPQRHGPEAFQIVNSMMKL